MHRLALSRRQLLQAGAAASVLTVPWAPAQKAAATPLPAVGAPYPLAAVPLLGGGRFEPAQAEGRALVLYWWASWCPFCAQQSPEMQKLWAAQKDRGLRMLALSIDKKPDEAVAYLQKKATPSQPRGSALNWPRPTPSPRACPSPWCAARTAAWCRPKRASCLPRTWWTWRAGSSWAAVCF
ncbi:TlpA family protein disulfide reductase [Ottowia beijingensis]|uniref:TlpA family protein disulfide reductase n=1 Tax=Ottowia beijingensis TaxID=1207057 RepID=UPI00214D55D2|nr:TlpA disulfide reductase family protein [Ottowia beijingensis]